MRRSDLALIYRHRWSDRDLAELRAVWEVVVREYFQSLVPSDGNVLDVGCGFCHFLNAVRAKERIGVDANPEAARYASPGVEVRTIDNLSLEGLPSEHFDFVFISNVIEHLNDSMQVVALLRRVRELLSPRGRVVILQPNFRLLGWRYFDFIDHKTILTDCGMREALDLVGLRLEREVVRFLPYTSKVRFPHPPALVSLYLRFPILWYFFGKQSLFVAIRSD
jgi:2-polyprenyl-3-methyl-5-hydroxy-6-metoxy-1,4-benzoquinol methylase